MFSLLPGVGIHPQPSRIQLKIDPSQFTSLAAVVVRWFVNPRGLHAWVVSPAANDEMHHKSRLTTTRKKARKLSPTLAFGAMDFQPASPKRFGEFIG